MKKILLGTTALAAAGAFATHAQAAEPIQLNVGGYYQSFLVFGDYDQEDAIGEQQNVYVKQEGEIAFTGKTTLDNGLEVGVNVELEGYTSSDQIDEHFVWFEGTFGRIEIGAHDPAPYHMHYGAPSAVSGHGVSSPNFFHYPLGTLEDNLAIATLPTDRINASVDSNKIIYFTPRFNGFQLGVSYAPDFDTGGGEGGQYGTDLDGDGEIEDEIAFGMNFVQKFNDVAVNLYAGGGISEGDSSEVGGDSETHYEFNGGGNVTFGGFTVGGSYQYDGATILGDNDVVRHVFTAGLQYAPSAQWAFSVTGYHAYIDADDASGGNQFFDGDEFSMIEAGGRYVLGPGVILAGGVHYYDAATDFGGDDAKVDGLVAFFGSTLVF